MATKRKPRKYELRRRADAMLRTRRRITDAAIELHRKVGPARTSIVDIAALAGVQRHTVYRYFPTEADLLQACSTEYWTRHPPPDVSAWRSFASPGERVSVGLRELYGFYRGVEPMLANTLRDSDQKAEVKKSLASFTEYLDTAAEALISSYAPTAPPRPLLEAAVQHAVAFSTWQSLVRRNGLDDATAARLMTSFIDGVVQQTPRGSRKSERKP